MTPDGLVLHLKIPPLGQATQPERTATQEGTQADCGRKPENPWRNPK
jgi:hypothetical protein